MWSGHRHTSAEEKLLFVGVGLLLPHAELFCFSLYTPLKEGKARARACVSKTSAEKDFFYGCNCAVQLRNRMWNVPSSYNPQMDAAQAHKVTD